MKKMIDIFKFFLVIVILILNGCTHYKTNVRTNETILQPRVMKGSIEEIQKIAYEAAKKEFPDEVSKIHVEGKNKVIILREWLWRGDTIIYISIEPNEQGDFVLTAESKASWRRLNPTILSVSKGEIAGYMKSLDQEYKSYISDDLNNSRELNSLAEKLEELKTAFDSGLIDQAEFEEKRRKIINKF